MFEVHWLKLPSNRNNLDHLAMLFLVEVDIKCYQRGLFVYAYSAW